MRSASMRSSGWRFTRARWTPRTLESSHSSKRDMKKLLAAFAIVALAGVATWAAHDETERVHQTVKLDPGGTLRLKSFSGRVNITGADTREVVIDAVRRGTR